MCRLRQRPRPPVDRARSLPQVSDHPPAAGHRDHQLSPYCLNPAPNWPRDGVFARCNTAPVLAGSV